MCGRVTLYHHPIYYVDELQSISGLDAFTESELEQLHDKSTELNSKISQRYNISPTSQLLSITQNPKWDINIMKWGLIPSWAKDNSMAYKTFNARSETMAEKPTYRSAFKHSRCIVPIDGYYEWKKQDNKKIPYYISDTRPLFLAGLSEPKTQTVTIVTKDSKGQLEQIHNRQPIALEADEITFWLDSHCEPEDLLALIQSSNKDDYEIKQVSSEVNNSRNEGSHLIETL